MLVQWVPVFLLIAAAGIFVTLNIILSSLLSEDRPSDSKLLPYESGNEPEEPAQRNVTVHYALVAVLFVLFDVELIFMYPWAMNVAGQTLVWPSMGSVGVFVIILAVGYFYAWREGIFEWT